VDFSFLFSKWQVRGRKGDSAKIDGKRDEKSGPLEEQLYGFWGSKVSL